MRRNYSKTCPNHDINKICIIDGCTNIGSTNSVCPFCGNKRRKSKCRRHLNQDTVTQKYMRKLRKKECENTECNKKKNLTTHHIDGNRSNNEPTNLMTLCRDCHDVIHNKDHE